MTMKAAPIQAKSGNIVLTYYPDKQLATVMLRETVSPTGFVVPSKPFHFSLREIIAGESPEEVAALMEYLAQEILTGAAERRSDHEDRKHDLTLG